MPNREFLEKHPLYSKFKMTIPVTLKLDRLEKAPIHAECPICTSPQTYNMIGEYYDNPYSIPTTRGALVSIHYLCASCGKSRRLPQLRSFLR
jgi:transposase-like protein